MWNRRISPVVKVVGNRRVSPVVEVVEQEGFTSG